MMPPEGGAPRRSQRFLAALAGGLLLIDMLGYTAMLPLLPDLRGVLGATEGQIGILVASVAYGTLVFGLPMAGLAGRLGPRRVMLTGAAVTAASLLVMWTLPSYWWVVAARVLHGVVSSAMWVAGPTWVAAAYGGLHNAKATTRVTAIGMLGTIVGPALGGWAARPDDLLRAFLYIGIALALLAGFGVVTTRAVGKVDVRPPRLADAIVAWRSPLFVIGGIVVTAASLTNSSESVVIVLGLGDRLVSERTIGLLFSAGGLGLAYTQSISYRILPRMHRSDRGAIAVVLVGISVAVALVWPTVVGFSAALVLLPLVSGLAYGLSLGFLSDGAAQGGSTVAVGVAYWSILWAVGASVGPTLYGWLLETAGETPALASATLGALALSAAAWLYGRARLPLPHPQESHE